MAPCSLRLRSHFGSSPHRVARITLSRRADRPGLAVSLRTTALEGGQGGTGAGFFGSAPPSRGVRGRVRVCHIAAEQWQYGVLADSSSLECNRRRASRAPQQTSRSLPQWRQQLASPGLGSLLAIAATVLLARRQQLCSARPVLAEQLFLRFCRFVTFSQCRTPGVSCPVSSF